MLQRSFAKLTTALARIGAGNVPGAASVYRFLHRRIIPPGERLVEVLGNKMYVDNADRVVGLHLFADGVWEKDETELFLSKLRPGMFVLDVGANIGYYTLLAARAVGPLGRVVAFEPEPRNFSLMQKSVAANGFSNVTALEKGVSSEAGRLLLHLDGANCGAHSLSREMVPSQSGRSIEVETVPLDDFFDEASRYEAGAFLKMDVQGAEGLVVRGASRILGLPRITVLSEFWPDALSRMGTDPAEFLARLGELGFQMRLVHEAGGERGTLTPAQVFAACRRKEPEAWVDLLLEKAEGA